MIRTDPLCLTTPRLTLIPFSAELLDLVLTDRGALEQRLSARFLPTWDWEGAADYLAMTRRAVERDPSSRVWRIYFILHNQDNVVIGDVGLKGPPDDKGAVEFHAGLVESYRGHGYGLEASRALFEWAFAQPEVRLLTGVNDWDNTASIRMLKKLGMRRVRVTGLSLLWCLSRGIAALDRLGMRGTGAFLRRRLSGGIRLAEILGRRRIEIKSPSLVWHLPNSRYRGSRPRPRG